ncbi:4Fe-4S binding protein [Agathobaculum sp.]|uniref:4Fe-4S binding protein n=1 Tax=Agathobaculum sp. TaxID=2048138 RepID=UPI002A81FB9F|nr:4Fe-4S binding protein [Agathobaculum sp.]MDY3618782.1 4Fe-4S binding protein [Agathobaculum sp.]
MLRKIIQIEQEKCNGCGLCANACHEGAIGMVDGKARLLRDDYCDGLGDCLPVCPTGAITFVEREAAAYDEQAVQRNKQEKAPLPCGCPGSQSRRIEREQEQPQTGAAPAASSALRQWPVQIKLAPVNAPYFDGARLLVAADCTAYAYGNFHGEFIRGKVALIGCPKLDEGDYSEKLAEILRRNNIRSLTVVRMEVPCCGGIERAAVTALQNSGKMIPWQVVTISTDGQIVK